MNQPESASADRHPREKRLGCFSVRILLLAVALLGVFVGWSAYRAQQQEAIISRVRELGGTIRLRDSRPATLRNKLLGQSFLNPVTAVSLERPADYSFLADLSALQNVSLIGPEFTDIAWVAKLDGLTELTLHSTGNVDLTPLAKLTHLRSLSLTGSLIVDISPVGNLTQLEKLSLADTSVRDLSAIAGLTTLDELNLSRTPITDIRPVANLRQLSVLKLDWTTIADVSLLQSLDGLSFLSLVGCNVRDLSPLSSLANLRQLTIAGAPVDNMEPVLSMRNLRILSIDEMQIESSQFAALKQHDPSFSIGRYFSATPTQPPSWLPAPLSAVAALDSLPPNSELAATLQHLGLYREEALWEILLSSRTTLAFKPPEGYLLLFFIRENPREERRILKRIELLPRE